jgi:hypothetical protein
MFDIDRAPLITEIRCQNCRATLTVDSDHRPTIERSIAEFEKRHHCRISGGQQNTRSPHAETQN